MKTAGNTGWLKGKVFGMIGLALVLAVGVLPTRALADTAKVGYPNSMASLGDSITRAYNTGSFPFTDAIANSWSTGTSTTVNSHYRRILAANSLISGKNSNDAKTGAVMNDLNGQATTAASQGVEYVTILMGANDVCKSSESAMTPVGTFHDQFQAAMNTLSSKLPDARIFVASIPNVYNLWSLLHTDPTAVTVWKLYGICQSMLANPTSTAQTDVDRRARVQQRNVDFNTQLQQVCALYIHCHFDNNAVYNTVFATTDVSTRDYFHPSIAGQTKLANVSYGATFNFDDTIAPSSTATTTAVSGGLSVALSATDNVGVAGIEYRIGGGAWTPYTGPVTVATGSTLTWRAVDVNGNIEASHSLTA
jgi:lysophospholipase L1-like esterase